MASPDFRCDENQYALILSCAKNRDMKPWNQWREAHPDEEIWLQGEPLLSPGSTVVRKEVRGACFKGLDLRGAYLFGSNLDGACFYGANLEGANLSYAHLTTADLRAAHLKGAVLQGANLQGADARSADFENANLFNMFQYVSHLEGACLSAANLKNADLSNAHLEGTDLSLADLRGAALKYAAVDGATMFWACKIDGRTDFTGVGLDSARVEPGLKQRLEYNVRRKRWEQWYGEGTWISRVLKHVVRLFWWMSDYGTSTGRIALLILVLAFAFAAVYYLSALVCPPGIVQNLLHDNGVPLAPGVVPLRAFYLSLQFIAGLGELRPIASCVAGYVAMLLHILLGYLLLAALVTRLAILFTGGGPASGCANKTPDD